MILSLFGHRWKFGLSTRLSEFLTDTGLIELSLLFLLPLEMIVHLHHCSLIFSTLTLSLLLQTQQLAEISKLKPLLPQKTKFGLSMRLNEVQTSFNLDDIPWKLRRQLQ